MSVTGRVHFFAVDEQNRWHLFAAKDALGSFDTWQQCEDFRKSLVGSDTQTEDGPAWTPKSGGY